MKKAKLNMQQRHVLEAYIFLSPWILGVLLFFLNPFLQSIRLSFSKITKLSGFEMKWIGTANYMKVFVWDVNFMPMFIKTIQTTLINLPIILVFSLFIAMLVNKPIRCKGLFRSVFFLPVLLGTGFVMKQLLGVNVDEGAMNMAKEIITPEGMLVYLGPRVIGTLNMFLNSITLILWKSGVQIILFLAGLQGISPSLYESARCDSATEWEMFWKITLPMISPVILLNFIYTLIDSFTDVSNPIVDYIINTGFKKQQYEYSAAIGWVYFIFVFALAALVFLVMRKRTYNAGER